MKQIVYKGKIWTGIHKEDHSTVFIGYNSTPIAERFEDDDLDHKQVSVRYWLSDKEMTKDELREESLRSLVGGVKSDYYARYSDYTGYLWTEDNLYIGNHNLLSELKDSSGKFIYLEIDVHGDK